MSDFTVREDRAEEVPDVPVLREAINCTTVELYDLVFFLVDTYL